MCGGPSEDVARNLSSLELQRARKQLDSWCRRRNRQPAAGGAWCLESGDSDLLLRTCGGPAVLRLCRNERGWLLLVPVGAGGWLPYPGLPQAGSIDAVIEELEQAPLHIHW